MKYFSVMALVIGCGFGFQAQAQDQLQSPTGEHGRYDKKIEKAAARKAAEKIGSLRGLILADDEENFIRIEDLEPKPKAEIIQYPPPARRAWQRDPGLAELPPMVMNEPVDEFVTGRAFKFDANGNPIKHHQDYPRPTPLSVARSLLDAIQINPYPGDN